MVHLCAYACVANENQPKDHSVGLIFKFCFFFFLLDPIPFDRPTIDRTDAHDHDGITRGK